MGFALLVFIVLFGLNVHIKSRVSFGEIYLQTLANAAFINLYTSQLRASHPRDITEFSAVERSW